MRRLRILVIFIVLGRICCQAQLNYFEYLTTKDGLSDYSINSFYEDEYNRMWVATRNGLNCYNGNSFFVWGVNNGLNDTYVRKIVGDKKGNVLIQTRNDAFIMDLRNDSISRIPHTNISSIAGNEYGLWVVSNDTLFACVPDSASILCPVLSASGITTVLATSNNRVWVASKEGIRLYVDGKSTSFFYPNIRLVTQLYEGSDRSLWACTRANGLYQCSRLQINHFEHIPNNLNSLIDNDVRCITEDLAGCFWIGFYGGLCRLNPVTGMIHRYEYDPQAEHALGTFSVWALATDCQGTIWIGTYFGGIDLINPQYSMFTYYGTFGRDGHRLSNPIVTCACADEKNDLWIGTNGGGVNHLCRATNTFTVFPFTSSDPQYAVKAMWEDNEQHCLWVGTHRGGLCKLDLTAAKPVFRHVPLPESNIRQLIPLRDSLGVMTQHHLYIVSRQTGKYRNLIPIAHMPVIKGELSDGVCYNNSIWFAQANHLYAYPLTSASPKLHHYDLSANITTLFADSLNGLLIGTDHQGLLQKRDSVFVPLTAINQKLSSLYIMDILSHQNSYLIATNHSLYSMDLLLENIYPIPSSNDFPLEAIVEHSCSVIGSEVCVGGVNGMIIFSLQEQQESIQPASLILSDVMMDNNLVDKTIFLDSVLSLHPRVQTVSFVATATGAITRHHCRLRYRLLHYDKEWVYTANNATVSYTNLPKGTYLLEIECVGTNLRRSVWVRVLPQWYETWWAVIIYILLGGGFMGVAAYYFAQYIERKTKRQLSHSYQQELQKATTIVMNHLADSEFNIERFAREMLLSRTGLFNRMQDIAGQTPNDFILGIRMREAAKLLRANPDLSIFDISVRVGFNSCSYFIKCFHRYFGSTPSSWRKG